MQHGRKQELVLDILESAVAVLRRERKLHGRPVGDVIINLETAHAILTELKYERSPFDTLRQDPFEEAAREVGRSEGIAAELERRATAERDRTMQERHPIDREAARKGFTE